MTKLLYIGDYSNTGFGAVSKGLLRELSKDPEYQILQFGINYRDLQDFDEPWNIVPAGYTRFDGKRLWSDDAYGFTRISHFLRKFDPDIVFINNDYPVAVNYMVDVDGSPTPLAQHRSLKILYAPIDSEPVPPEYAEIAKMFDLNIAYTHWQRAMMAEHDPLFQLMPVLYHGYNPDVYFPMDKKEAKAKLVDIIAGKLSDGARPFIEQRILDTFLVYYLGTNQFRKDIPCLFRAFAKLHEEYPDTALLPQTEMAPMGYNGWNLKNLQHLTGVKNAIMMGTADVFNEEEMNIIMNAADVLAYPTRGEGFGLPSFEAMAVKTPVVVTGYAASHELHKNGRGYFIEMLDVIPKDIEASSYLALPDHRSLYKWLKHVHNDPQDATEKAETAYKWVQAYTWPNQAKQLKEIFSRLPKVEDASNVQSD